MAKVAATPLLLEEGFFNVGEELPASALKYLDEELVMDSKDYAKQLKEEDEPAPAPDDDDGA